MNKRFVLGSVLFMLSAGLVYSDKLINFYQECRNSSSFYGDVFVSKDSRLFQDYSISMKSIGVRSVEPTYDVITLSLDQKLDDGSLLHSFFIYDTLRDSARLVSTYVSKDKTETIFKQYSLLNSGGVWRVNSLLFERGDVDSVSYLLEEILSETITELNKAIFPERILH